jgi:hypothetical protein
MVTFLDPIGEMRKKDLLTVLRRRGICAILGAITGSGLPVHPRQPDRPQGRFGGSAKVAWRPEQPDAVMGSGPVVAGRCPRLAIYAPSADYHLEKSGQAPGRFSLSATGGSTTFHYLYSPADSRGRRRWIR